MFSTPLRHTYTRLERKRVASRNGNMSPATHRPHLIYIGISYPKQKKFALLQARQTNTCTTSITIRWRFFDGCAGGRAGHPLRSRHTALFNCHHVCRCDN